MDNTIDEMLGAAADYADARRDYRQALEDGHGEWQDENLAAARAAEEMERAAARFNASLQAFLVSWRIRGAD